MTDEPKRCAHDGCKLLTEEGSYFCILHQPTPKDVERFKMALYAQLHKQGPEEERNGRLWFEGYVFPVEVVVGESRDEESDERVALPVRMEGASFSDAKFEGRASFSDAKFEERADFRGATFEELADFSDAKFEERADFRGATFEELADFRGATFEELADFRGATFALAYFRGATFAGADFSDAKFEKLASFSDAKFEKRADFSDATFEKLADFSDAKFEELADFRDAKFEELADFSDAKFEEVAYFRGATFAGATFRGATFALATFSGATFALAYFRGATFAGVAYFSGATFAGVADFSGATFAGVDFLAAEARNLDLDTGNPHIRGWGHARCGVRLEDCSSAPSFWRFAQRTYSALGECEKADAAFYFARVAERKAQRAVRWPPHEGIKRWGWIPWLLRCLLRMTPKAWPTLVWAVECVLVRWTTAYGASLARLFITWAFVVASFGAAYSLAPSLIGNGPKIWSLKNWVVGLHFSVTTFTTLGLGDLKPLRLAARVLTSAEAILGAVLVALAVLVIGRRYMRQS